MEKILIEVPKMYGDHHVQEVRRILFELPGVEDVYASSAFLVVEVTFDPEQVNAEKIENILDEAGYLGELPVPVESGEPVYLAEDTPSYYRHTEVFEKTQQVVGFEQEVIYSGRPLWNCPGLGVVTETMED